MTSSTGHVKIFENAKEEYKRACFCFKAKHDCRFERTNVAVSGTNLYKALKSQYFYRVANFCTPHLWNLVFDARLKWILKHTCCSLFLQSYYAFSTESKRLLNLLRNNLGRNCVLSLRDFMKFMEFASAATGNSMETWPKRGAMETRCYFFITTTKFEKFRRRIRPSVKHSAFSRKIKIKALSTRKLHSNAS